MCHATDVPSTHPIPRWLAGLARGVTGAGWMMGWLGIGSLWRGRSFWTAENLMAGAFYSGTAWRDDFAYPALAGLAVYIVIYGTLGAAFAAATGERISTHRVRLLALAVALAWYLLAYKAIYRHALPLLAFEYAETPTLIAHFIFGLWLGQYRKWLAEGRKQEAAEADGRQTPGENMAADEHR
ncbi:MAG: hypothetical protein ACLQVN_25235 [Bryobacteraceae bacterium]